jgi:small subunit ribosomal protein S18
MPPKKTLRKRIKKDVFEIDGITPDYKDVSKLKKFISERGRIFGRDKTGLSAKNQRLLTKAIKRARHLALMPFVTRD